MQCVLFKMGNEICGFDIQNVQEIVRSQKHTKIPNVPEYIEGIINLRGKVIPVLNLAKKFGAISLEENESTRLIVLNLDDDQKRQIAIKVAEVTEVITIEEEKIDQVPEFKDENNSALQGIAKLEDKLVMIIDPAEIIAAEKLPDLEFHTNGGNNEDIIK